MRVQEHPVFLHHSSIARHDIALKLLSCLNSADIPALNSLTYFPSEKDKKIQKSKANSIVNLRIAEAAAMISIYSLLYILHFFILSPQIEATSPRKTVTSNPRHWFKDGQVPKSQQVQFEVALTQASTELAVDSLLRISDHNSSEYGRHWTAEEIAEAFRPSQETFLTVLDWLNRSGIPADGLSRSHGGGHLLFNLSLDEAEKLMNITCYYGAGGSRVTCDFYRVPQLLSPYVDYVSATIPHPLLPAKFRSKRAMRLTESRQLHNTTSSVAVVDCDVYTAPSCLRDIYNIPNGTIPHPENSFGIYEIAYATWRPEDLDKFFELFQPELIGQRPAIDRVDGGYLQTEFNITAFNLEPDLDFEYAIALVSPQVVSNIQVGDEFLGGDINNMLAAFDRYYCGKLNSSIDPIFPDSQPGGYNHTTDCGTLATPKVLSISYADPEASFPAEYLQRQCYEFLKLGLMGVTVIVSSGDTGTESGIDPGTCISQTDAANITSQRFSPQWPSACPWVTSVGGTQRLVQTSNSSGPSTVLPSKAAVKMRPTSTTHEVALSTDLGNFFLSSSGGFSNVFAAPAYQDAATAEYQLRERKHLSKFEGYFNSGGRGFPDVAALSSSYVTVIEGQPQIVYGTSAAAPVFASIISMINNERLNAGKSTVGFLNPVLYSHSEVLNDVTKGSNNGCGFNPAFQASTGWDAVTGLGSPDYERMRTLFLGLP